MTVRSGGCLLLGLLVLTAGCGTSPLSRPAAGNTPPVHLGHGLCVGAVPWTHANNYVGRSIAVQGPVISARYEPGSDGDPTFLNIGADYPDASRFVALIWGADRRAFPSAPEAMYANKTLCVSGTVDTYQGVPEIQVSGPSQITVGP